MATRWKMKLVHTAVVALAGRRIDLPEAEVPRFPLESIREVGRRVCEALRKIRAVAPQGWQQENFELVLSTDVIRGKSGHPNIVAAHFW